MSFQLEQRRQLEGLSIEAELYGHPSGAKHLHLNLEDDEKAFMVAFRTPPDDDTGVAHILEHTVLCGSEKFPGRDPFFSMLSRSLNTFMNAMTASDWTAYPFATRIDKDFFNLLEVYLDAVFSPLLRPLDFAQEGHRIEFTKPDDPKSDLHYAGVVFNEMKGAFASPNSAISSQISRHLKAGSCYANESGGDPIHILDLTHDQLQAFHRRCYSPANAIFATSGSMPIAPLQQRFDEIISRREQGRGDTGQLQQISPPTSFSAPKSVQISIATSDASDDRHQLILAWLLAPSTNFTQVMRAHLLTDLLLDSDASPLRRALLACPFSRTPAAFCGLDDSEARMSFYCGLQGVHEKDFQACQDYILETLEEIATKGFSEEEVDSALRRFEFSTLDLGGDSIPFGLELLLDALPAMVHQSDPLQQLDAMPMLQAFRKQTQADVVASWLREMLIDNPHRLNVQVYSDPQHQTQYEEKLVDKLRKETETLSPQGRETLHNEQHSLIEHQARNNDLDLFPRLELSDIPSPKPWLTPIRDGNPEIYSVNGNGIVLIRCVIPLAPLAIETISSRALEYLPFYGACLQSVGTAGRDWLTTAQQRTDRLGSFAAGLSIDSMSYSEDGMLWLSIGGKALLREADKLVDEIHMLIESPCFTDGEPLRERLQSRLASFENSVASQGHSLAMLAASASYHPGSSLRQQHSGFPWLQQLRKLAKQVENKGFIEELGQELTACHQALASAPSQWMVSGDEISLQTLEREGTLKRIGGATSSPASAWTATQPKPARPQAWVHTAGVNYTALAVPAPSLQHQDAAALAVAAQWLRQQWLHPQVREQGGAYGAGAVYATAENSFRWFSYRDPRFAETYADFDASADKMLSQVKAGQEIDEAILSTIRGLDSKGSPHGEAATAFRRRLRMISERDFMSYRERILSVTSEDLKRVTERWLAQPLQRGQKAAVVSATMADDEQLQGMDKIPL